jgi:primosomal protein N' (replication factor Y) (superfamily II helicase)
MPDSNSRIRIPILKLAVPSPLRHCFDYLPPADSDANAWRRYRPGIRFRVPFGRRQLTAVLVAMSDSSTLDANRLKAAITVLDEEPLFSPALMQTFLWAANYYQHPPGEVFSTLLPASLRQGKPAGIQGPQAWAATRINLAMDSLLPKRATRQHALLLLLQSKGPLSTEACESAGFSAALRSELVKKGLIEKVNIKSVTDNQATSATVIKAAALRPNCEQQQAITPIVEALSHFQVFLLDGVTGSGKTEVYFQVIATVLEQGKQALVLVPEINLTPQTISRFKSRFAAQIVALHSGLTDKERLHAWELARQGNAAIIIGTRSAIFTPMAKPGIIIIDEEHDASFKQQDGFRYSARDLSIVRAQAEKIPVILGSATPALESLQNAISGKFQHLVLSERAGLASIPHVSLLDIDNQQLAEGFSPDLLNQMHRHLEKGKQVLVFINRRGFAPTLYCKDCGAVFECNNCDAQLTLHKYPPLLRCHHCESQLDIPTVCACCGSKKIQTRGLGTQKTEQFLCKEFENIPVLRIDRDSTRAKHSIQSLLDRVNLGDACILVGTQMLAKGHHFPNVTLVAVLDADFGLFSPDFRAQEQMLQLLLQVAGRSGREVDIGRVIIQTRHASHPLLQSLPKNNYHMPAQLILKERRSAAMPPFSHLALLRAEANKAKAPILLLNEISELCRKIMKEDTRLNVELHGPLPAPMERKAGRYRYQLLMRSKSRTLLQILLRKLSAQIDQLSSARKARWSIDVDPVDLI